MTAEVQSGSLGLREAATLGDEARPSLSQAEELVG
jgi:hypothetical protein